MRFGERVRVLRTTKGLSVCAGKMIGVSSTYVSKIENEKIDFGEYPSEDSNRKLASVLEADETGGQQALKGDPQRSLAEKSDRCPRSTPEESRRSSTGAASPSVPLFLMGRDRLADEIAIGGEPLQKLPLRGGRPAAVRDSPGVGSAPPQ